MTTGRQDYGILRSSLILMREDPRFELEVWAGGMHLSEVFGRTIDLIRADGMPVTEELDFLLPDRSAPCLEAGRATAAVGEALARSRPDALVLLGDRYETLAAGVAASIERTPIVHLHGGEESEGAIDNAFRHALTKLSHLHLVSHASHAKRVLQMGEDPRAVVVVGAAGLDNLYRADLLGVPELESRLKLRLQQPVVVVTVHPTTLGGGSSATSEVEAVSQAMEMVAATYVVTQPNADSGGDSIRAYWKKWSAGKATVALVDALGERDFWGLLRSATAVLGNSSSGIIEAPAAGLPVVNVGERQRGRLRPRHVVDVEPDAEAIARALRVAVQPETRQRLAQVPALYPSGPAAPRIVQAIVEWEIPRPAVKRFHEAAP